MLLARFYATIAAFLVLPAVALAFSLVEFHTAAWSMVAAALIPYGIIGLLLVRAALPKRLTVTPNGVPLHDSDGPGLLALCDEAAEAAEFYPRFDVYVDLSAAPSSLRYLGLAGVRSRYAIVLGLPALTVLTHDELRSVLAYLFAVVSLEKLPEMWLKETKQVMARLVQLLASRRLEAGWLAGVFKRYVARADALLASQAAEAEQNVCVSLGPLREKLARSAQLFNRYWMNDVNPLLQRGFIPPVTEGFERVLRKPSAAVEVPATGAAILLLRSPWQIEHRIASALGQTRGVSIEQVSWELVPWRVILPSWEEEVEPHAAVLSGIQVSDVAQFAEHRLLELGRKLTSNPATLPGPERLKWKAARTLAVALALTLRRAGWQLAYDGAGDTWEFRSGLRSLDPFGTLDLLASKRMRPEEWAQLCSELGIANLPLAAA